MTSSPVYDKNPSPKFVDLSGRRYGAWTVIEHDISIPPGHGSYWRCICGCGTTATVRVSDLTSGKSTSCGCLRDARATGNLLGQTFGRWTVIGRDTSKPKGRSYWLVRCECGTENSILGQNLRNGMSHSCGCLVVDTNSTHGMKNSPEYTAWRAMINRCYRSEDISYHNYGGRGITVCNAWQHSFEQFFADMGLRPSSEHSLDRIDGAQGYSATNCRWSTREEQQNNTRANRMITYKGKTQSIARWARETGITRSTIVNRLARDLSPESILSKTRR